MDKTYDFSWEYPGKVINLDFKPQANSADTMNARFKINDVEYYIIPGPPPYRFPVGNTQYLDYSGKLKIELLGDYVWSHGGSEEPTDKILYLPFKIRDKEYLTGITITFIHVGSTVPWQHKWIATYSVMYQYVPY